MRSDYEYKLMMQPKQLNEQIRELRGKAAKLEEVVAARELENMRLQEVRSRSLPVPSLCCVGCQQIWIVHLQEMSSGRL